MTEELKQTPKQYKERFINLFVEIETLKEDVAQLKEEVKDELPDLDLTNLVKIAQLEAQSKLGDVLAKAEKFAALVEELEA